ncbi:MAG: sialate O-acetylesterase [Bacteroidota bacterium]|nr:sialate O-acetylesterase [Bacteroidota bacterium]
MIKHSVRYLFTGFLLFSLMTSHIVNASLHLPNVLSSNMVLQRDKPVAIWGTADPGIPVHVRFAGQDKSVTTSPDGKWLVTLDAMPASFEPRDMAILAGKDTTLTNILVGEVWLCGGQSNMEYPMRIGLKKYKAPKRGADLADTEWKSGGNTHIRLLRIEKKNSLPDCTTNGWTACADSTLAPFSAAGYYFGKHLQEVLNVPVGLISSNWGGSRIERWTPASAYEQSPLFAAEAARKPVYIDQIDAGLHYNSMIAPLAPYTLRGFIWYQGESNAMIHDANYAEKTQLLLNAWRTAFQNPDAPFYYVQIAPYYYTKRKDKLAHTPETMAEFCELQTKCLSIPGTGQAIVTDLVDDPSNIHPSYKWEVGRRLSLWALARTYGQQGLVYSGPQYKAMKVKGIRLELTFDYVGNGLVAGRHNAETNAFEVVSDAPLTWFEVAGKDGVFHAAVAMIRGDKVLVSCPEVKKPVQVRFAWNETAMPNLFNREGLPAVPFRASKR